MSYRPGEGSLVPVQVDDARINTTGQQMDGWDPTAQNPSVFLHANGARIMTHEAKM